MRRFTKQLLHKAPFEAKAAMPTDRTELRKPLADWRSEPDLGGLRDPAALAKLPSPESAKCLPLWRDLDAVLGSSPLSK